MQLWRAQLPENLDLQGLAARGSAKEIRRIFLGLSGGKNFQSFWRSGNGIDVAALNRVQRSAKRTVQFSRSKILVTTKAIGASNYHDMAASFSSAVRRVGKLYANSPGTVKRFLQKTKQPDAAPTSHNEFVSVFVLCDCDA